MKPSSSPADGPVWIGLDALAAAGRAAKHDDCHVLAVPKPLLPHYRRGMEEAITGLLCAYGVTCGKPYTLSTERNADLKLLHRLRVALHGNYWG